MSAIAARCARATVVATLLLLATLPLTSGSASAQFTYRPPGELVSGSGRGRVDDRVYAPGIRYPVRDTPSFLNSQVWGVGGSAGPSGSQCDDRNFSYPWHDNYCETRSWSMPLCPAGEGHQGQDIRASSCRAGMHPAVAATDGMITNVGSYSVYLTASDGTRYDYLHMRPVSVRVGQRVSRGDILGYVSNEFGGTPTTVHLHFNIRQSISGVGSVYVPTYMSLVRAYEALVGPTTPRFRAEYVSQSFPLASMPFELRPGEESMGYLELRNTGSETWRPGETFLGTTEPRDSASPLAGPDWGSPGRAATIDRVVPPGMTGRFTFTVRAPLTPGDYPQYFGVVQELVSWFGDDGGPIDRWIQVRVTVVEGPGSDAGVVAPEDDAGPPPPPSDAGELPPPLDAGVVSGADASSGPSSREMVGGCGCVAGSKGSAGSGSLAALMMLALALWRTLALSP